MLVDLDTCVLDVSYIADIFHIVVEAEVESEMVLLYSEIGR